MSKRQDKNPSSGGSPNSPMQAMATVFAKAASKESGVEAAYLSKLSKKAALKANEG